MVGRANYPSHIVNSDTRSFVVGEEACQKRGLLSLSNPIEHGTITNWDHMEKVWSHTFNNELRVYVGYEGCQDDDWGEADIRGVIMTQAPLSSHKQTEMSTQIMFETLSVQRFYIASTVHLSSIATLSSQNGICLTIGEGVTAAQAFADGEAYAPVRNNFGGCDLNKFLSRLMMTEGTVSLTTQAELYTVAKIREELCYVSLDFAQEEHLDGSLDKEFELPDCTLIHVGTSQVRCPEILFSDNPAGAVEAAIPLNGRVPLHRLVLQAADYIADPDAKQRALQNVQLCGGLSATGNLDARLQLEINALLPSEHSCRVSFGQGPAVAAPSIGASIMSQMPSMSRAWMHEPKYMEVGPRLTREMQSITEIMKE